MGELSKKIKKEILNLSDVKYREFQTNLCPNSTNIVGVRIPALRKYANELNKKYPLEILIKNIDNEFYEEIMLKGILIGINKNIEFNEMKKYIEEFVPKIDNWAVCDTFCAGLKAVKSYKNEMWEFIQKYIISDKEFEVRFAVVVILKYYIEEQYLEKIFNLFSKIECDKYYTKMAVAWVLTEALTEDFDKTLNFLKKKRVSQEILNKTIRKAIESHKISPEQKEMLNLLKNKEQKLNYKES